MKNKVFLPLMEQMCMIALFSIVAALCLRGFALAKEISNQKALQDMAVFQAQNMAETIKNQGGVLEETTLYYNNEWEETTADKAVFCLEVNEIESGHPLLGKAQITVYKGSEQVYGLKVGWQEGL